MQQGAINSLWGKKPKCDEAETWTPLHVHLLDAALVAGHLWDEWVPQIIQDCVVQGITGIDVDAALARKILVFLAGAHDIGKASPLFQSKSGFKISSVDEQIWRTIKKAGLPLERSYQSFSGMRHCMISNEILLCSSIHETLSVVAGGHHGSPPSRAQANRTRTYNKSNGFTSKEWEFAQKTIYVFFNILRNSSHHLRPAGLRGGRLLTQYVKDFARQYLQPYTERGDEIIPSLCPICNGGKSAGELPTTLKGRGFCEGAGSPD